MGYSEGFRDHLMCFYPVLASSMRRSWSPPSPLSASPSSPCHLAQRKISVQAEGKVSFSLTVWKLKCVKKKKEEKSYWEAGEGRIFSWGSKPHRLPWGHASRKTLGNNYKTQSFPTSQVAQDLPCSGRRWQPQGQVDEKFSSREKSSKIPARPPAPLPPLTIQAPIDGIKYLLLEDT